MSNVGLVLGAGGCAGIAFHAGVTAAIADVAGWDARDAKVIVGSSAGSLTGAMLRLGLGPEDLCAYNESRRMTEAGERMAGVGQPHRPRAHLVDFLRPRGIGDISAVAGALRHPSRWTSAAMACALLPEGPIDTEPISSGLDRVSGDAWPEHPLWINAVRLGDGQRTVFGRPGAPRAALGKAVAASCAIPGYYTPVRIGGQRYVDGGVASFHNLDLLNDVGLDLVIVSAPMSFSDRAVLRPDMTIRGLIRRQLEHEVAELRRRGTEVVVIEPDHRVLTVMGLDPMDARPRASISRMARHATAQLLGTGSAGTTTSATGSGSGPTLLQLLESAGADTSLTRSRRSGRSGSGRPGGSRAGSRLRPLPGGRNAA